MSKRGIITAEQISRQVLPNGIILLVRENHDSPVISLRGLVKAGAIYDTDERAGLADFVADSLERGTRRRSYGDINKVLDNLGATLGIGSSDETSGFYGRCLSEDFDALLDIASDILLNPTFPRAELEKVRGEILTALREAKTDSQWVANDQFHSALYPPGHPFHRPAEGTEQTVSAISRHDLVRFHTQHYRPDCAMIAISGDIGPEEAAAKIGAVFSAWRANGKLREVPVADVRGTTQRLRKETFVPGSTQADIVLGFPGLSRLSPDYQAANVANMILGRLGLSGRLGDSVRDRDGLAYYVSSHLQAGISAGPWVVQAGVNPSNLERALTGIEAELVRLRSEPVSADELLEAQDYLTGSLALRLETNDGVAGTLLGMETYGLGMDYLERYAGIIRGLTRDDLLAAAHEYIDLEHSVVIIAGPVGEA
jgi:zinc protease